MDVFLTGGTGYVGGAVARGFLEAGHRVRLLYRSPQNLPPEHARLLPVRGDLLRPQSLRDAIAGSDAICHTAAVVRSLVADARVMYAINVDATRALLELASELGVPRVIYTSSFMALGPSGDTPVNEETPTDRDRFHNLYERTKYLADRAAREAQAGGAPVTILYPTVVFGPGALTPGNLVGRIILRFLQRKLAARVGSGSSVWSYVFLRDVVEAHRRALSPAAGGRRYIITGQDLSMDGFLALLAELSGIPAPERRLPRWVAVPVALLMEVVGRVTGRDPELTREVLEIYEKNWAYDGSAARRDLGLTPTPFRQALAETIDWARAHISQGPIDAGR